MPDMTTAEVGVGVVTALATGGVLSKVWETLTGRKTRQLNEAEIISRIATEIREEIRAENLSLRAHIDGMILAMSRLTDLLDDVLPRLSGISEWERAALRAASHAAKIAM